MNDSRSQNRNISNLALRIKVRVVVSIKGYEKYINKYTS